MKKAGLLFTMLVVLALTGCGALKEQNISENSTENSTGMSIETIGDITPDVVSGSIFTGEENREEDIKREEESLPKLPENWKDLEQEELLAYLPECELVETKFAKIVNIDDVVQNCKKEEVVGRLGISGLHSDSKVQEFFISKSGKILDYFYPFGFNEELVLLPICKKKRKDGTYLPLGEMDQKSLQHFEKSIGILSFKEFVKDNIFEPRIVNNIFTSLGGGGKEETRVYGDIQIYCRDECANLKENMAIKKNNNVIISSLFYGTGSNSYKNGKLIYLMNGKLYNPGDTKRITFKKYYDYISESKWHFSHFSGNVAIMKKITNGKVLKKFLDLEENVQEKYNENFGNSLRANYILETCEIPLNK